IQGDPTALAKCGIELADLCETDKRKQPLGAVGCKPREDDLPIALKGHPSGSVVCPEEVSRCFAALAKCRIEISIPLITGKSEVSPSAWRCRRSGGDDLAPGGGDDRVSSVITSKEV